MENLPLISVIIPCYNQARFLPDALNSCLKQIGLDQNFQVEVIVINDGSTDHLAEVENSFRDIRQLIWFHQPNQGLTRARNAGLKQASGQFIQFLDADDWLHPQKLLLQLKLLQAQPDTGMVFCNFFVVPENGLPEQALTIDEHPIPLQANLFIPLWLNNLFPPHSPLVRREWTEYVGDFNNTIKGCEDYEYWLRLSALGCLSLYQPERLVYYRRYSTSMSSNLEFMAEADLTARTIIAARFPTLVAQASVAVFNQFTQLRNTEWLEKNNYITRLEAEIAGKASANISPGKDLTWTQEQVLESETILKSQAEQINNTTGEILRQSHQLAEVDRYATHLLHQLEAAKLELGHRSEHQLKLENYIEKLETEIKVGREENEYKIHHLGELQNYVAELEMQITSKNNFVGELEEYIHKLEQPG